MAMKRRSTVASGSGVATLLVIFALGLGVSGWAPGHPVNHVVSVSDAFARPSAPASQTVGSVHHVVKVSDSFPVTDSVSARLSQGCSASAAAHDEC